MAAFEIPLEQIKAARGYTTRLLGQVADDDWFRMPAAGVTHVAWQVGHLTMAEFRLALERVRGARDDDAALLPAEFLTLFGKDSAPTADPGKYATPSELRAVFDAVHERVLRELPEVSDEQLAQASDRPHPEFTTRLGSLYWCARHEMLHAGQIGLLRRLLGAEPIW